MFFSTKSNIKITYGKLFEFSKDSSNVKNKDAYVSAQNFLADIKESVNKTEFNLIINDSVAKFEYNDILQDEKFNKAAITFGGGNNHYYDLKKDNVYRLNAEKNKLIKYDKDSINWILTNESKIIQDFLCYRAYGKTKIYTRKEKEVEYDVWFCPQFNNKCGPAHFFGLPGLIFEASYKNKNGLKFYLKKIEYIENVNTKKIIIPDLKIISEEENHIELSKKIKKIKGD